MDRVPPADSSFTHSNAGERQVRTCCRCGESLPLSEFRRRSANSTAHEGRCRPCLAAYMREYRGLRRASKAKGFVADLNRARSLDRAAVVCKAMLDAYGGVDGLAQAWHEYVVRVSRERPGSPRALQAMLATLNLLALADARSGR